MRLYTRILRAVRWVAGAAAMAVGCNNSADPVDQSEFKAELVHALCDSVQNCCAAAERNFIPEMCNNAVVTNFLTPLQDTTLIYDSQQAGRCIQAVTQAAQACKSVDVTTCFDAFVGSKPPGTPCTSSFECAAGPNGFGMCGPDNTCAQPARAVLGQACAFTCVEGDGMPKCHSVYGSAILTLGAACHSGDGVACVATANGPATCQPMAVDCKQN